MSKDDKRSPADEAMDRYAGGDVAAFEVVYNALHAPLYAYAWRKTRSDSAAQDATHQTFEQILAHAADWRFGSPVLPWAYAILRAVLVDLHRRSAREELSGDGGVGAEEPSDARLADEALIWREDERRLWRCLQSLPEKLRHAFELVKIEGLSVKVAAEVLGITPTSLKVRVHRARVALMREYDGPDDPDLPAPAGDPSPEPGT
jgi:RNA polymerase sigma-70 factor (ECF subfamily)